MSFTSETVQAEEGDILVSRRGLQAAQSVGGQFVVKLLCQRLILRSLYLEQEFPIRDDEPHSGMRCLNHLNEAYSISFLRKEGGVPFRIVILLRCSKCGVVPDKSEVSECEVERSNLE